MAVLAGFDPRLVLGLLAVDLRYAPAHHRVRRASNGPYIDRNFRGMVIVFDRLFGAFAAERADEPLRYGLAHPNTSRNPFVIALGEWGRLARDVFVAPSPRAALRVAFGPPV